MHHSDFIAIMAQVYTPITYLELGLYQGETFNKVKPHVKRAIGVDSRMNPKVKGELYSETASEFFKHFNDPVDMVFIDADHSYESVIEDLKNVLNLLNPGGVVILHDTNPEDKKLTVPGFCGDCYRVVSELELDTRINIVTLPLAEAGLSIITWKNNLRINSDTIKS